jgi:PhnB protein
MASPALEPIRGNMGALFLVSDSHDDLRAVFSKLAAGADQAHFQPLHQMPFGLYGQFYDRFAVQWIFRGDVKAVSK